MRVIAASRLGPHGAGPAWADGAVHDEPPAGQGAQGLKLVRGVHVQTISDDVSTPEKQLLIRAFFKIKLLTHFDPHEGGKIWIGVRESPAPDRIDERRLAERGIWREPRSRLVR